MIEQDCTILINKIYNWLDYQNTVVINVANVSNNCIFQRTIDGKVKNNYMQLGLEIPCSIQDNIQIRLYMKSGTQLGKLTINVKEISVQRKKYYLLQPQKQHLIQIEIKNKSSHIQNSQHQICQSILNELDKSTQKKEQENNDISLKKKYRIRQKQLIQSVSQYRKSYNIMSSLTKQLITINKQLRSKSKSRSKLLRLKQSISQQKLKFNEIVYPYLQRTPRHSPSNKSSRSSSKHHTPSTFNTVYEYGLDSIKNDEKFQSCK